MFRRGRTVAGSRVRGRVTPHRYDEPVRPLRRLESTTLARTVGTIRSDANLRGVTSAAHVAIASALALVTWRALQQPWVDQFAEPTVVLALRWGLPLASAAASAFAVIAGRVARDPTRLLVADATSWLGQLVVVFALALAPLDRDVVGVLFVTAVAARFAPAVVAAVRSEAALPFFFAVAVAVYASLAVWHQAGSLPLGDQVHYLLTADRLAHGSVDGTIDAALFRKLTTLEPNEADIATHLPNAPTRPRTIQGYALPLLLLPGWLVGGRLGAELVVAFIAAAASAITALILRDTIVSSRLRGAVWAMAAFLPPALLIAFHLYPNVVGAAAIGAAYRFGFTAPTRRPLLAGAFAGLTLLLNPRDGFVLLILLAATAWSGRRVLGRLALAAGAVAGIAIGSDAVLYGVPLPYAGYLFGTAAAQALTHAATLPFRFWGRLPATRSARTFGPAASAP